MIKIEDLKGLEIKEAQEKLQNDIADYTAAVAQMEMSELDNEEQKWITELSNYDKYLDEVSYKLPKSVTYNDNSYSKESVCEMIAKLIGRQEIEFQYTLGMMQLVDFWKQVGREVTDSHIKYKVYDSTLRILGNSKFKGYDEWLSILVINEFTSCAHDEYTLNTSYLIYISKLHNAVMEQMQKLGQAEEAAAEEI